MKRITTTCPKYLVDFAKQNKINISKEVSNMIRMNNTNYIELDNDAELVKLNLTIADGITNNQVNYAAVVRTVLYRKYIGDDNSVVCYTAQLKSVKEDLLHHGIYVCNSCMEIENQLSFHKGYEWMMKQMGNLPGSNIGKYPIWLSLDSEIAESFTSCGDREILVFKIPKEYLLLTDHDTFTVNTLADGEDDSCLDISESDYIQATCWYLKYEWMI